MKTPEALEVREWRRNDSKKQLPACLRVGQGQQITGFAHGRANRRLDCRRRLDVPPNALTFGPVIRILAQYGAGGALWRGTERIPAAVLADGYSGVERILDGRSQE